MATYNITVDTDGVSGDYSSLSLAEAGEQAGKFSGDIVNFNCQATTNVADTTRASFVGQTAGVQININGSQTSGILDASKYRLIVADLAIVLTHDDVNVSRMQIGITSGNDTCIFTNSPGTINHNIDKTICFGDGVSSGQNGMSFTGGTGGTVNVTNSIIYNMVANGLLVNDANVIFNATNVTVYDTNIALRKSAGTFNIKNCLVFSNAVDYFGSPDSITYSASDDAQAGVGNFQITQTASDYAALVIDAPGGDFSVTDDSSELYNAGTNTGAPSDDIIGTSRPQATTTDIGAFELIVGTTTPPTTLAPTTEVTTLAPTTLAPPTTISPTTAAPTTKAPTSLEPTTLNPTTIPTTTPPTTLEPTTLTPTTILTTSPPTTLEPTTPAPTTLTPTTITPTTVPTTSPPTTLEPTTVSPTTISPTTLAPTSLPPTTLTPTTTLISLAPTTSPSLESCGDKYIKIIQDNLKIDIIQDDLSVEIIQC